MVDKTMKNNRILILNVELSGINNFLFSKLEQKGYKLIIVNVPFPQICSWLAKILTISPDIARWKLRYSALLAKMYKTPTVFKLRTRYCQRIIKKLENEFDLILQISGLFAPYCDYNSAKKPYITFNDYTMALALKYPPWSPFKAQRKKWIVLETCLYRHAAIIFATNENARKSFIRDYRIPEEKVINIGNGIPFHDFKDFTKIYDNKTILFIGKDFKRKGGFVLLEAFKRVKEQIADARLIMIGPNNKLLKINQPGVEIFGYLPDRERIDEIFKQASIFVLPSLCEPFGLVFLEAMVNKLPCIGTKIDAINEIIDDNATGFLVEPGCAFDLSEKIVWLMKNPQKIVEMGDLARRTVLRKFTWDNVADKISSALLTIK